MPGTFDPELNLVYYPIGNPAPDWDDGDDRPGDNLYTSSIVALNPQNGELKWSKVEKGKPLSSDGTWRMQRDHAGHNNVHATFKLRGHEITYILGQRKNDLGQEEMHLKAVIKDGMEKAVNKDSPLVMSAFVKAQERN